MKNRIPIIIFFLLQLSTMLTHAQSQNFYLEADRVFRPGEEVFVNINKDWYGGQETFKNPFFFLLYQIADPVQYFSTTGQSAMFPNLPDSVLQKLPIVGRWSEQTLKGDAYQARFSLGKLEEGVYVVEAFSNGKKARIFLFVSPYQFLTQRVGNEWLVLVADATTGQFQPGFETFIQTQNRLIAAEKRESVFARFVLDAEKQRELNAYNGLEIPLVAFRNGQVVFSKPYLYLANLSGMPTFHLHTSRPAYRPGQVVKFHGVGRQKEGFGYRILSDTVTYWINDPNGTERLKKTVVADADGHFADSLLIGEGFPLGEYSLHVMKGGQQAGQYYYGSEVINFRIEEYKKPEYEVLVTTNGGQLVKDDVVKVKISGQYLFGAPVSNAEVNYRVVREEVYRFWYPYYWYRWFDDESGGYGSNAETILAESALLDEKGEFTFEFPATLPEDRNYRFTILADVTDASRRTIAATAQVNVVTTTLQLSAQPEQYYYRPNESVAVRVSAVDLDEQPVATELTVRLLQWSQQSNRQIAAEQKVKTDPKSGEAIAKMGNLPAGYYTIEVEGKDTQGRRAVANGSVYVFAEGSYYWDWWDSNTGSIELMTDKKVYQAGDTVRAIMVLSESAQALLTLSGERFMDYHTETFSGEGGAIVREWSYVLPQNAFGTVNLFLGYIREGELLQHSISVGVVALQQYLDVSITFDTEKYKPGETGKATVKVTDSKGKPVPNARVTLQTADQAIYFLYPDKTPDIRKHFYATQTGGGLSTEAPRFYQQDIASIFLLDPPNQWRKSQLPFNKQLFLPNKKWVSYDFYFDEKNNNSLRGLVMDHETGELLAGASVRSGTLKTTTDANGYFHFPSLTGMGKEMVFSYKGKSTVLEEVELEKDRVHVLFVAVKEKKRTETLPNANQQQGDIALMAQEAGGDDWGGVGGAAADERMVMATAPMAKMAMYDAAEPEAAPMVEPVVRQDFRDEIYWNTDIVTNAQGEATVSIKFPDNLTTWRSIARVITPDSKVGQVEVKTIVTKNLLVRMETPRFLTAGDQLLIATTVHNYLPKAKRVKVSLQAAGVTVTGTERTITVAPNKEQRIDWQVSSQLVGTAKLTVKALTDEESDAQMLEVPVKPYGLEMVTAQSGYIRDAGTAKLTINIPADVNLDQVALKVSAVPSVTSALLSSLDQLIGYPYGCVEQTMSRFLPNLIVSNTLRNLGSSYASNIKPEELAKMVKKGTERLRDLQHSDGGWGWWENDNTHPFMTAYVVHGLSLAQQLGYEVPEGMIERGAEALAEQLKQPKLETTTKAYGLMALATAGQTQAWEKGQALPEKANAYELALLLQAAHLAGDAAYTQAAVKQLEGMVQGTGAFQHWGGKKFYYSWQDDDVETTANVVKALTAVDPNHPLVPNAVQWLMTKRRGNAWHNTRQTAMIINGLQAVIRQEARPDAEYVLTVNGQVVDRRKVTEATVGQPVQPYLFEGQKASASAAGGADLRNLLRKGDNVVEIVQTGKGTAYINTQLTYFLGGQEQEFARLDTATLPFRVERTYYRLDRKQEASGKYVYNKVPIANGSVKSGEDVLVKVRVHAKANEEYVLIEDPIPAGFEFIRDKTGYAIVGEAAYDGNNESGNRWAWNWRWDNWYTHAEYRDSHYALTITELGKGIYEYSYLMKAQIPGTYRITPAVTQLMYYPEQRGFSPFAVLKVVD